MVNHTTDSAVLGGSEASAASPARAEGAPFRKFWPTPKPAMCTGFQSWLCFLHLGEFVWETEFRCFTWATPRLPKPGRFGLRFGAPWAAPERGFIKSSMR